MRVLCGTRPPSKPDLLFSNQERTEPDVRRSSLLPPERIVFLRSSTPNVPEQISCFSVIFVSLYQSSCEASGASARSPGCEWEVDREAPVCQWVVGTLHALSDLSLSSASLMKTCSLLWNCLLLMLFVFLITGIVLYQHCVQSVGFSMPTKAHFIHVFLNLLSKAWLCWKHHLEMPLVRLYPTASYHSWHSCQIKFGYLGPVGFFIDAARGFADIKPTKKPLN